MGLTSWSWQPPRLWTHEEQQHERPAAWQEIVFDLVFVVSISELAAIVLTQTILGVFAFGPAADRLVESHA